MNKTEKLKIDTTKMRTPLAAYMLVIIVALETVGLVWEEMNNTHMSLLIAAEFVIIALTTVLAVLLFFKVRNSMLAIVIFASCAIDICIVCFSEHERFLNVPLVMMHVVLLSFTALFILINTTHGFMRLESVEHVFSKVFKVMFAIWVVVSTVIYGVHTATQITSALGDTSIIVNAIIEFVFEIAILVLWAVAHFDLELWINEPVELIPAD